MDFLSSDGFPVTLDGAVEFRVIPERAAEVFVKYNESDNGDEIDEEIIAKIITPESRSLCRTGGSKLSGGQFISGNDREVFQRNLVKSLTENCKKQGVEILAVAITRVEPPQDIAEPVRDREVAKQKLAQFNQEKMQQLSEAKLQIEVLMAEQKQKVVQAEALVIVQTTKAEQDAGVAATLAEQKLKVTQTQLEAAKDKASAIVAKAQADADVIRYNNKAELAGLASRVAAFDGDGAALAQNILVGKLAPGFRSILSNSEGPLMDLFGQFVKTSKEKRPATSPTPDVKTDRGPDVAQKAPNCPQPPFTSVGGQAVNARSGAWSRRRRASWPALRHRLLRLLAMGRLPDRGPARPEPAAPLQGAVPVRARQGRARPRRHARQARRLGPAEARSASSRTCRAPAATSTTRWSSSASWCPTSSSSRARSASSPPRWARSRTGGSFLVDNEGNAASGGRSSRPGRYRMNNYAYDVKLVDVDACVGPGPRAKKREGRPDPDPAGLRRRGDQQDRQPAHRRGPGHPGQRPPAGDLLPQPRGEADRHHQHRLQRDHADGPDPRRLGPASEQPTGQDGRARTRNTSPAPGIEFPSNDGFPIHLDYTAIWGILPDQAPDVVRQFGTLKDVEQKVILPADRLDLPAPRLQARGGRPAGRRHPRGVPDRHVGGARARGPASKNLTLSSA